MIAFLSFGRLVEGLAHPRFCRKVKHEHAEEGDNHDGKDDVGEVEECLREGQSIYDINKTTVSGRTGVLPKGK